MREDICVQQKILVEKIDWERENPHHSEEKILKGKIIDKYLFYTTKKTQAPNIKGGTDVVIVYPSIDYYKILWDNGTVTDHPCNDSELTFTKTN
ncbi:MAG: hypothetical protein WDZ41_01885 [Candidatus Babeliales bacterium]